MKYFPREHSSGEWADIPSKTDRPPAEHAGEADRRRRAPRQIGEATRTLDERERNRALRQAVLEGWCYIPTAAESRRGNRLVLAEIDTSRVRVKPAAVLVE